MKFSELFDVEHDWWKIAKSCEQVFGKYYNEKDLCNIGIDLLGNVYQ